MTTITASELALRLHGTATQNLRIELDANDELLNETSADYVILDRWIEFTSLEARCRLAANAVWADVASNGEGSHDQLYARARNLRTHEFEQPVSACAHLLLLAGSGDVPYAVLQEWINNGRRPADVIDLFATVVRYVECIDIPRLADLTILAYEKSRDALPLYGATKELVPWLTARVAVAHEMHAYALEKLHPQLAIFLEWSLVAIAHSDFQAGLALTNGDVDSELLPYSLFGAGVLCQLYLLAKNDTDRSASEAAILTHLQQEPGPLRDLVARTACDLMGKTSAFDTEVQRLATGGDEATVNGLAGAFFQHATLLISRPQAGEWLKVLEGVKPEGPVAQVDLGMQRLYSHPEHRPIVLSYLKAWVIRHVPPGSGEQTFAAAFDGTVSAIAKEPEVLGELLLDWWFEDDQPMLQASAAGIVCALTGREALAVLFPQSRLDEMASDDLLHLARRILGYVHHVPTLIAMILSMLKTKDPKGRIHPLMRSVLLRHLGVDYLGSTIKACRSASKDPAMSASRIFLRSIAKDLDAVAKRFEELPQRRELLPPATMRLRVRQAQARQWGRQMTQVHKSSLASLISTQVKVKGGQRVVKLHGSDQAPAFEMDLREHSVSIEAPSRLYHDPIGLTLERLNFRMARRKRDV